MVDDDLSLRRAIVGMLAAGGYTCVEAADGAEALSLCRTLSPDAVVLDVMMPRVDGLEVVRRLRAAHAGEVLSKEDIVRAVWGPEYVGTSINIPVYIRHLREKVEPDPGNPRYILTDWGAGYSLGTRAP